MLGRLQTPPQAQPPPPRLPGTGTDGGWFLGGPSQGGPSRGGPSPSSVQGQGRYRAVPGEQEGQAGQPFAPPDGPPHSSNTLRLSWWHFGGRVLLGMGAGRAGRELGVQVEHRGRTWAAAEGSHSGKSRETGEESKADPGAVPADPS